MDVNLGLPAVVHNSIDILQQVHPRLPLTAWGFQLGQPKYLGLEIEFADSSCTQHGSFALMQD